MPPICLAIETSTATCSVALAVAGAVIEDTRALGRTHNEHLLGMIDGLCRQAAIEPKRIDTVLYSAGPGSFTGVRIAASAAMAIALASDAQLFSVNSLLALTAQASSGSALGKHASFLALRRSRKDAYYLAAYRIEADLAKELLPPRLVTNPPELPTLTIEPASEIAGSVPPDRWCLVGDEWPWEIPESVDTSACGAAPVAETLVRMFADPRFAAHFEAAGSTSGLPVYVGGSDGGDHPWRFAGQ